MDNNEPRFEEMLARLEVIVRTLEKGDTPLEESLSLYTEGADLIRRSMNRLSEAEQTVVRLQKGLDGAPEELPFAADGD